MSSSVSNESSIHGHGHHHSHSHGHHPHKLSEKEHRICEKIAEIVHARAGTPSNKDKGPALAEELYGFLRSRNLHNYKHLPCFPEVDEAWCALIEETDIYNREYASLRTRLCANEPLFDADLCQELFRFFLHRDGAWPPENPPNSIQPDEQNVPIHYRQVGNSSFHTRPHWDNVLPTGTLTTDQCLMAIEGAFTREICDDARKKVLAQEVLGFLKLKVALKDIKQRYEISPPSAVDQGWHALIHQTKLYEEMCFLVQATDDECDCDDEGDDEIDIIHHSMYQDGGQEARKTRLKRTHEALLQQLPANKHPLVMLDPAEADWVGYNIPVAFRLLLK